MLHAGDPEINFNWQTGVPFASEPFVDTRLEPWQDLVRKQFEQLERHRHQINRMSKHIDHLAKKVSQRIWITWALAFSGGLLCGIAIGGAL
jgi:hypothetical protein